MDIKILHSRFNQWLGLSAEFLRETFPRLPSLALEHRWRTAVILGIITVFTLSFAFPPQGRIIPVGREMREAYHRLCKTHAGRDLVRRVCRTMHGTPVYLFLGTTRDDGLVDYAGDTVCGVTRAYFRSFHDFYLPRGFIIYTNRDIADSKPGEIVRSIAFELENAAFAFEHPGTELFRDSPLSIVTQRSVMEEMESAK